MARGQNVAAIDCPEGSSVCAAPTTREAQRDSEVIVDAQYVYSWLETGNCAERFQPDSQIFGSALEAFVAFASSVNLVEIPFGFVTNESISVSEAAEPFIIDVDGGNTQRAVDYCLAETPFFF